MPMTPIATRIGRTRLLLLILGALVSTVIVFSMFGTAGATHTCDDLTAPHTVVECNLLTIEATNLTLQAAQDEFDDCAALYASVPFLIPAICDPVLLSAQQDAITHTGAVYQGIFDDLVAEHLALPEHHEVSKKVDVCHVTGSKKNPQKTINISRSALEAHLAHGDALGSC